MILTVNQTKELNRIVEKYSDNNDWIITDECVKYKNTCYENMIIGIGSGDVTKHLPDDIITCDTELTYYYQMLCKHFLVVSKTDNKMVVIVYKNTGSGLEFSKRVEKISV